MASQQPDSPPLRRVLVTGGAGFLGSHIVRRLLQSPDLEAVTVISRNPKIRLPDPRVTYEALDITNTSSLRALLAQFSPQVIIHAATSTPRARAAEHFRVNVTGTRTLLQCAKECASVRALVYTSSDSAMVPSQERMTEDRARLYDESSATYPYGKTKGIADGMVLAANSRELLTATLRVPGLYGEDDGNFVAQLVASMRKGEHKMQVGANEKVFEFCYVGSAAAAHVLAAKALLREAEEENGSEAEKVAGEAFFIADEEPPVPFFTFCRQMYAAAGYPVKEEEVTKVPHSLLTVLAFLSEWAYLLFTFGTAQPKLVQMEIAYLKRGSNWSIEKAKEKLDYKPVMRQDDAVKHTMEWAMANL